MSVNRMDSQQGSSRQAKPNMPNHTAAGEGKLMIKIKPSAIFIQYIPSTSNKNLKFVNYLDFRGMEARGIYHVELWKMIFFSRQVNIF